MLDILLRFSEVKLLYPKCIATIALCLLHLSNAAVFLLLMHEKCIKNPQKQ